jgi:hypothetical protein
MSSAVVGSTEGRTVKREHLLAREVAVGHGAPILILTHHPRLILVDELPAIG